MKAAIASAILAATFASGQGPSGSVAEANQPDQKVLKIPKSISHQRKDDGTHTYTISGLSPLGNGMKPDDFADLAQTGIPDCKDFTFGPGNQTCTFTASRELAGRELADAINYIAEQGGVLPYWAELEARDLPLSDVRATFKVEKVVDTFPRNYPWFSAPDDKAFELPFSLLPGYSGRVLITPATALCMCHSRYSVRILDGEGKVIWKDTTTNYAAISVAVADEDEDGRHELLLTTGGHEEKTRFRIAPE